MEKGWVLILSSTSLQVDLMCALLREQGVNAVVINKQDSSYMFGESELYVQQDEVIRAKTILNEENA